MAVGSPLVVRMGNGRKHRTNKPAVRTRENRRWKRRNPGRAAIAWRLALDLRPESARAGSHDFCAHQNPAPSGPRQCNAAGVATFSSMVRKGLSPGAPQAYRQRFQSVYQKAVLPPQLFPW